MTVHWSMKPTYPYSMPEAKPDTICPVVGTLCVVHTGKDRSHVHVHRAAGLSDPPTPTFFVFFRVGQKAEIFLKNGGRVV